MFLEIDRFYPHLDLFYTFNDLITLHYTKHKYIVWLREITKFILWNKLHSIVVVKYKHYSISGRRRCGIVVMDFNYYTGNCGSISSHSNSLGKWMNLRLGKPMPCEGNWVVSPWCLSWRDIDLHSFYKCENGLLLSLMQFNHIHSYIQDPRATGSRGMKKIV